MSVGLLAMVIAAVFGLLGALHAYWAAGGGLGMGLAVPEQDGRPVFRPSRGLTALVALALGGCALLVAALAGHLRLPLPPGYGVWFAYALSVLLGLRAIGDFRWVGFFKRVRGTAFARLDTAVYSPLCLALAAGVAWVAGHAAG